MNILICMGLLFSACLAFTMALPMASSELPVEKVAVVPEEETLEPAESHWGGRGYGRGYHGGYGRRYGGGYGHGYGHGYGGGYGHGYGHGYGGGYGHGYGHGYGGGYGHGYHYYG